MTDRPDQNTYTADEWQTIQALRQMPFGPVHDAAADALEYVLAERLGEQIVPVSFDEDTRRFIDELVRSGKFHTRGEVIADAVRELLARHGLLPAEDDEPAEEEPGDAPEEPSQIVVYPSSELETFSRQYLEFDRKGVPLALELDGDVVQIPSAVIQVLRAVAESLSLGQPVTVTVVKRR